MKFLFKLLLFLTLLSWFSLMTAIILDILFDIGTKYVYASLEALITTGVTSFIVWAIRNGYLKELLED